MLDINDVKFDIMDDGRPKGGQHVPSFNHGVKGTHIPTGLEAACKTERSQHKNKLVVMAMLEFGLNILRE